MKKAMRKILKNWYHILLMLGVVIMIFPFVWMLLSSLKTEQEILRVPPTFFPLKPTWDNYISVWRRIPPFATS